MAALGAPAFCGRAHERATLDGLLGRVRGGEGAALIVRGEAGIGKTALLQYCAAQAWGCRIAQVVGVESELEMPYAALHQLCGPMLGGLADLPEPQKRAVEVAFGLAAGSTPDRFVVGLAVLSLLADVAAKQPLVCVVDDAQWLDEASRQVLGFVGRRVLAEAVLLVFSIRESGDDRLLSAIPELTLEGLTNGDARALLAEVTPVHLDEQVRDRIIAETRGNPLALLELPKAMNVAELAGGFVMPIAAAPTDHVQHNYLHRVRGLPAPTRQLMLLAAADPTGDAALLWRAAESSGIGRDAAALAAAEDLLHVSSHVRFRHPLVRSTAYTAGSAEDRRAAHLALAAATDSDLDPERRVWHLAAAATGPDEDIAAELERMADKAQIRAGMAAAAAFLQRSVALTAEPKRRADRALAAARAHLNAGALDAARSLVAEAAAIAVDDLQHACVEQLRAHIEAAADPGREVSLRLLHAAKRLEGLDVCLARDTYLQAWWAAVLAGKFAARGGSIREVCVAVRSAPRATVSRPGDVLLDGLAIVFTDGRAAAAPTLRRAINLFVTDQVSADDWILWGRTATTAAITVWDVDNWAALSARQVQLARASGALTSLVVALNFHVGVHTQCGNFEAALALIAERNTVKEVTGIRMDSYGDRMLAALLGRPAGPSGQASDKDLIERGDGYGMQIAGWSTAVLNNGLGRYADAFDAARDVAADDSYGAAFALSELIEAAVKRGHMQPAQEALGRLLTLTVKGSDWAGGLEARARALLSTGEVAEHWYAESIACLGRTPLRPDLARVHLLYGEWLRRENRRVDARQQLRTAHEMFTAMGAEPFAERTRHELVATGEKVRKPEEGARNDLTPQEAHIARLARDGRTNPEIGAELFISARTVEWHLRKVFTKLGVNSRKGLHDALPTHIRSLETDQGRD
jgi:DNA-binding CsgD family transcriptional regulator